MEKNVSRKLMVEATYERLPHHIKEFAGLPPRHYQLSQDYHNFLESYFEQGLNPIIESLEEEVDRLRATLDDISEGNEIA